MGNSKRTGSAAVAAANSAGTRIGATALAAQSDRFLKGLAEKLFVYALGRTVEPTDAATIDQLVETTKSGGHSLRTLITAIVRTEAFQTK